jgi:hypothetical protein
MMTSQSTTGTLALARSIRDIVAHQPELVTEVWCRKIFRHILQLLERDYALGRRHAPLTPDTLGFDEHGEPALMSVDDDTAQPGEAADVQALGMVVHYAITQEEWPTITLRKRGMQGFSESLLTAVDKCMSPDLAERPRTIADLRNLLGIVALGPTVGAPPSPPVFIPPTAAPVRGIGGIGGIGKWQRWIMIGLAAIVLLAAGSAFWMLMRGTTNNDSVVLTLPEQPPAHTAVPAVPQAAPALPLPGPSAPAETLRADIAQASAGQPAANVAPAQAAQAQAQPAQAPAEQVAPAEAPAAQPPAARKPAIAAPRRAAVASAAATDDDVTTYKLMIKPWGTVYVDGSERGVSPPLKMLTLPAGDHTVRIVNPNFRDRVIRVSAGKHDSGRIAVDFRD